MNAKEARALITASLKGRPFKVWYREFYLHSAHWEKLRGEKLKLTPRCEHCNSSDRVQVHHRHYRRIYNVTVEDLSTVCAFCHATLHEKRYLKREVRPVIWKQGKGKRMKIIEVRPRWR